MQCIQQFTPQDRPFVIFLATDESETILHFSKVFGDRLVHQNGVLRSSISDTQELHWLPENMNSLRGKEVLIDALLLSKCDLLIHGVSNVSTSVLFLNPHLRSVYVYKGLDGEVVTYSNGECLSRINPDTLNQNISVSKAQEYLES